jgi:hypothetical protein
VTRPTFEPYSAGDRIRDVQPVARRYTDWATQTPQEEGFSLFLGWSGTESTITEATAGLLYQSRMLMGADDECGAIGGMLGRGNQRTRRKPAPMLLCPP